MVDWYTSHQSAGSSRSTRLREYRNGLITTIRTCRKEDHCWVSMKQVGYGPPSWMGCLSSKTVSGHERIHCPLTWPWLPDSNSSLPMVIYGTPQRKASFGDRVERCSHITARSPRCRPRVISSTELRRGMTAPCGWLQTGGSCGSRRIHGRCGTRIIRQ